MRRNKPERAPQARPLRSAAIVLYSTLGLLWLAVPQSVSNWTREVLPTPMQPYAAAAAETVEAFARQTGLPSLFETSREFFVLVTKK